MFSIDKAVTARLRSNSQNFEVLVDCNNAIALKEGRDIPLREIVAALKVYTDARKGLEASEAALVQAFGTKDVEDAIRTIIKKGEIQLTQEYREKLREEKRRQIINTIHRNSVDPKTHMPHPPQRIENAFVEAKVHIDEFRDANTQLQNILKKLRPILPIKFEIKEIAVKIAPEYAPKCYSIIRSFGTLLKDEWQSNGYWIGLIEIPGGLESDLYDKLNKICHGNLETRVVNIK